MNLTAILPPAGSGPSSSRASSGAPSGAGGFAARFAACSAATTADEGVGDGEEGDRLATDALTLAALASRTASAVLPLLTTVVEAAAGDTDAAEQLDGVVTATDGEVTLTTTGTTSSANEGAAEAPADAQPTTIAQRTGLVDAEPATPIDTSPDASGELPDGDAASAVPPAAQDDATPQDRTASATEVATDVAVGDTTGPAAGVDLDGAAATSATTRNASPASAVSTASAVEDQRDPSVLPAASTRGREPRDASVPRPSAPATSRLDGVEGPAPTGTTVPTATGRTDPFTPSAAAQRVLDIVTQLEDAPPPRVVVIETGEMRVRVGLDGGVVRLTVLGALPEGGEEFLRETADALEAGGFGAEFDGGTGGDAEGDERHADGNTAGRATATTGAPAARPARARSGLQL